MRIPIKAARTIGQAYGFDQVVILARNSETGMQHVTTWGRNRALCAIAGELGDDAKRDLLGWPEEAIALNEPSRPIDKGTPIPDATPENTKALAKIEEKRRGG